MVKKAEKIPCLFTDRADCPGTCRNHWKSNDRVERAMTEKNRNREDVIGSWKKVIPLPGFTWFMRRIRPQAFRVCEHNNVE